MGSRAVVVVCRDEDAARRVRRRRARAGVCYTRTGRRFFESARIEAEMLARVRAAIERGGLWDELGTDWVCLDCELMPWSAKAQELLQHQYAAVGAAARAALARPSPRSERPRRGIDAAPSSDGDVDRLRERGRAQLCRGVSPLLLAGRVLDDLRWRRSTAGERGSRPCRSRSRLAHVDAAPALPRRTRGVLLATAFRRCDLGDPASEAEASAWWEEMTARGGEGMVVKPTELHRARQARTGAAGREVQGPGVSADHLRRSTRLPRISNGCARGLGTKRSLALREFALGIEALERFDRGEPLRRVHECVFGVLALESEPVRYLASDHQAHTSLTHC